MAMVRALVVEDRLMQDVWIKIAAEGGAWLVGPSQKANIVPTVGIRRALELVCQAAGS